MSSNDYIIPQSKKRHYTQHPDYRYFFANPSKIKKPPEKDKPPKNTTRIEIDCTIMTCPRCLTYVTTQVRKWYTDVGLDIPDVPIIFFSHFEEGTRNKDDTDKRQARRFFMFNLKNDDRTEDRIKALRK